MRQAVVVFLIISVAMLMVGRAANADGVDVVQTFDSERITDYRLSHPYGEENINLSYTLDKQRHKVMVKIDLPVHFPSFEALEPVLIKLIQKADEMSGGQIEGLMAFEYLRCGDIAKKSVVAFHENRAWKQYLRDRKKGYIAPPYEDIREHLITSGVFSDVKRLLSGLSYNAELSSFEKLAVRKAGEFPFYPELKAAGIGPQEKFPVPLMLYFKLRKDVQPK